MRLHDTAFGSVTDLLPAGQRQVSMYVCGPTVYDVPHLGHGRFSLVFDVLRRYLEWKGFDVRYVSNITDIDDNIINRANRDGRTSEDVARQYEEVWYDAMGRLGVRRPDADPHATAYVEQMVDLVAHLVEKGTAYPASDGVYFSVESVPDYGLLARQPLESLRAGARVDVAEEKRSPLDFVLWKLAKPGEPHWPSPWGAGRPGWHTECVVMSLDLLGEGFDLHGGGQDLAFPHHENERAQAVAAGRTFARHWAHNGFVEVGGEKMSKSLGNFRTLADLLDSGTDPRAYRLLVLQSHYRAPIEVTAATVKAAENTLARLDDFARRTAGLDGSATADPSTLETFCRHMDDDLDTPKAVAALFDAVRAANQALDSGDTAAAAGLAAAVREMASAVGLGLVGVEEPPPEVVALVEERERARAGRDFGAADRIRDQIAALGWAVEDTPQGPRVHKRR
ncbi:MAG: cysteine--tRNA ligase [Actinomycetota bacterium]|nr:cysteine--tRNA ligase [Actinomycetota bacterium]